MLKRRCSKVPAWQKDAYKLAFFICVIGLLFAWLKVKIAEANELYNPAGRDLTIIEREVVVNTPDQTMDAWVGKYVDQYFNGPRRSEVRMILHCLLHRESGHGGSNAHGDGGLAGGPLQYHEATWNRMRKQMLKAGLIEEIGSRYDMEQAIHTTVWAIANGRGKEWGPIFRDSNGSNYASCQTPSWY